MLEGWKAYALPVVAAVLLAVFFAYRCSMNDAADPAATTPASNAEAPPQTRRERIERAIEDAGPSAPPLPDAYRDAVDQALRPLVARCRTPRPDDAAIALAIDVEVAAADGIGGLVREIEIRGVGKEPSASLGACIEEGARSLQLPDPAATGVGTYALDAPP